MVVPSTLLDIRNKVRRITARPSDNQITDSQIDEYINTYYIYDMPQQLKQESFRFNYQFITQPNIAVYEFPTDYYLEAMPPVYIGGYQCYMTQSRENFFRISPKLNYLQQAVVLGTGAAGPYTGTLINTPIMRGWQTNPVSALMKDMNWAILFSADDGSGGMFTLIDDGLGHLMATGDAYDPTGGTARGTINYLTGVFSLTFTGAVAAGVSINAQYVPYVASRPQEVLFFQDQFQVYPIPDQAYTVSFEVYKKPTALLNDGDSPQLKELWQLLAYGAADKIFADNADVESLMKFRPLLEEQMKLCLRRTINQYSSERAATIYTEQAGMNQYPFGNLFSGF